MDDKPQPFRLVFAAAVLPHQDIIDIVRQAMQARGVQLASDPVVDVSLHSITVEVAGHFDYVPVWQALLYAFAPAQWSVIVHQEAPVVEVPPPVPQPEWWHGLQRGDLLKAKDPAGCQVWTDTGRLWLNSDGTPRLAAWLMKVFDVDIPNRFVKVAEGGVQYPNGLWVRPGDVTRA